MIASMQRHIKSLEDIIDTHRKELAKARGAGGLGGATLAYTAACPAFVAPVALYGEGCFRKSAPEVAAEWFAIRLERRCTHP